VSGIITVKQGYVTRQVFWWRFVTTVTTLRTSTK